MEGQNEVPAVVAGATGLFGLIGMAWAWIQKNRVTLKQQAAERKEAEAATAALTAQETTFKLLAARQVQLEEDVRELRQELETERRQRMAVENELARLKNWIREQGLTPPV